MVTEACNEGLTNRQKHDVAMRDEDHNDHHMLILREMMTVMTTMTMTMATAMFMSKSRMHA